MPAGTIPVEVERYVDEAKEKGYDESHAWAIAWSRYCKYKNPGSNHCKQDSYKMAARTSEMALRIAKKVIGDDYA